MLYSNFYFKSRNKLSVLLLLLAAVSLFSFSIFFFGSSSLPTRASKKTVKRHQVVNVLTNQVGVFWQSEKQETGWVVYGESPGKLIHYAYDERDVEGKNTALTYHYVILKNLNRDTVYHYKIISANEILAKTDGTAFSVRTAQNTVTPTNLKPAYGKVIHANGQPAQNVLLIYSYPQAIPLLAVTKSTGEWLIPLQFLLNTQTLQNLVLNENEQVSVEILIEEQGSTTVKAPLRKTNPFPNSLIIGRSVEIPSDDVLSASTQIKAAAYSAIDIIYPKEAAVIPAVKPLLKGLALSGKEVGIKINSVPSYTTILVADKNGEWKVEVPIAISAGNYILTVVTENDKNKKITLTRKFTVAKSGEQVLGEATGSANTTVTPPSTILITPTFTPIPSPQTTTLPNTGGGTPTPSTLPDSGFTPNMFMYLSLALIIIGAGFLLVF